MRHKRKATLINVTAAFGLAACAGIVRGQTITNVSSSAGSTSGDLVQGTVYEYGAGVVPYTCCHGTDETPRQSSFGAGILNDQLYGSQTALDTNQYRQGVGGLAYQSKGIPDPNYITETDPVYFQYTSPVVTFNLPAGVDASNLTDIVIEDSSNPAYTFGQWTSVAITDTGGNTVNYTGFGPASDGPTGQGLYETDIVSMAGANFSGNSVTLSFPSTNAFNVLDEIDFYYIPPGPPKWKNDASGDWNIASNWGGSVIPTGVGAEADLFDAISLNRTVSIDNTAVTLGTLNFNNAHTYTVAGSSTLTMQTSSGNANIIVQQGTGNISVALIMASDTTLNVAPSSTLNISGPLTVNSGVSVSQTGGGTVNYSNVVTLMSNAAMAFGNTTANTLNVSSGAVASITGTGTTLNVYNLNLAGGTLDVNKNQVNINYNTTPFTGGPDPVDTVRAKLLSGYAGGLWNGTGITSSAAAADPGHGIGYSDNGSTVTLKYTLAGDATMDGTVNFNDLLALAGNYTSTTAHWTSGDFNYDGTVNFSDLLLLAGTYTQTLTANPGSGISSSFAADWALAEAEVAAVPEPASIGILAIGAIGLMNRRNRARRK